EEVRKATTLTLDVAANAIEGGREKVGGLRASVRYANSRLRVSVSELAYLGGNIDGDADASFARSPPTLKLNAAARRLSLERLFRRLDTAPVASGPLDLDVAVTANGADPHALLASMSGKISGSIWGGSLADRTINLAGQRTIEWLFTPTADGSAPLVCFVTRFEFDDGIGSARQLVLETDKVQAVGTGTLNLREESMDFVFTPRAKRNDLVGKVGPIRVSGPLSNPDIDVADGARAAKVVTETISLPLRLLHPLVDGDGKPSPAHKPCVLVPGSE
ncbi:MAG: AsmA-like C-terminal region-containing protein, partial [Pseudomonadota bacterium]|nr:AsmA-like C-terminal region-containing protein [Pseudomonadota bacterium]